MTEEPADAEASGSCYLKLDAEEVSCYPQKTDGVEVN